MKIENSFLQKTTTSTTHWAEANVAKPRGKRCSTLASHLLGWKAGMEKSGHKLTRVWSTENCAESLPRTQPQINVGNDVGSCGTTHRPRWAYFQAEDCLPEWSFQMQWSSAAWQNHEKRNGTDFLYLISVGTGVSEHFLWLKGNRIFLYLVSEGTGVSEHFPCLKGAELIC